MTGYQHKSRINGHQATCPFQHTYNIRYFKLISIRPCVFPGFWLMHCHIEYHALNGMALVVESGETQQMWPAPPWMARCGDFNLRDNEYWESERNFPKYHRNYMIDREVPLKAEQIAATAKEITAKPGEIEANSGVTEASKYIIYLRSMYQPSAFVSCDGLLSVVWRCWKIISFVFWITYELPTLLINT